ncbi:hypothetical protein PS1_001460 [Malus domestica]
MTSQDNQPLNVHFTVLDDDQFRVRGKTLFVVVVIFTVVLLVTLFLLYARWLCRFHLHNVSSDAPPAPPLYLPEGLDAAFIRALPIVLYQESNRDLEAGSGGECCICLGVFEDGEKVKVLPNCRHSYHSECVDTWLSTHSSCPICRAQPQAHSTAS